MRTFSSWVCMVVLAGCSGTAVVELPGAEAPDLTFEEALHQGCSCHPNRCAGVRCESPPSAWCVSATTVRRYASPGVCATLTGTCRYGSFDEPCASGQCRAGACVIDRCAGVRCEEPPAADCADPTTVRRFGSPGTCAADSGQCRYSEVRVPCAAGETCSAGVCVAACSASTCAGCCAQGGCVALQSQTSAQCGLGGSVCLPCGSNQACQAGACVADVTEWRVRSHFFRPVGRSEHALVYDPVRRRVVLFGGVSVGAELLQDTWEWDGTEWLEQPAPTRPPARRGHALAYDATRGRVVLFGGYGAGGLLADTWEWDGATWALRTTPTGPSARSAHAMAFDGQRVVLHGGTVFGATAVADTWTLDGTGWKQVTTNTQPPARLGHVLGFDSRRGRVVLFGGTHALDATTGFADTWEWNGASWAQRSVSTLVPHARTGAAMAFDAARGRLVLFGGMLGGPRSWSYLDDTWEFDGVGWAQRPLATHPSFRTRFGAAYDVARARTVVFGGYGVSGLEGTTWEYGRWP